MIFEMFMKDYLNIINIFFCHKKLMRIMRYVNNNEIN